MRRREPKPAQLPSPGIAPHHGHSVAHDAAAARALAARVGA
jgi:hypothetical protein